MNKLSITIFVIILVAFGGILFVTQSNSNQNMVQSPASTVPTLPPDSATFKMISGFPLSAEQQQQQAQGQQNAQAKAQAQAQARPTYGVAEGLKASYSAVIKTSKGDIEVLLSAKDAPRTVFNFIDKSKRDFYKNLTFHRVEDWVIQGGDPEGTGTGGGLMQTELNSLPFVEGSLGVARGGDIRVSNDSQFFITKSDSPHLNQQYTNFGIVTSGMDVVKKIAIGDKILGITIKEE
jgi:cyclophilin family peptidyl-prolyl cis-trans isomerase